MFFWGMYKMSKKVVVGDFGNNSSNTDNLDDELNQKVSLPVNSKPEPKLPDNKVYAASGGKRKTRRPRKFRRQTKRRRQIKKK